MTISRWYIAHQVATPLLGIGVHSFLPFVLMVSSGFLNRTVCQNHLQSFKNADVHIPPSLNESEPLGVEPDHKDVLMLPGDSEAQPTQGLTIIMPQ